MGYSSGMSQDSPPPSPLSTRDFVVALGTPLQVASKLMENHMVCVEDGMWPERFEANTFSFAGVPFPSGIVTSANRRDHHVGMVVVGDMERMRRFMGRLVHVSQPQRHTLVGAANKFRVDDQASLRLVQVESYISHAGQWMTAAVVEFVMWGWVDKVPAPNPAHVNEQPCESHDEGMKGMVDVDESADPANLYWPMPIFRAMERKPQDDARDSIGPTMVVNPSPPDEQPIQPGVILKRIGFGPELAAPPCPFELDLRYGSLRSLKGTFSIPAPALARLLEDVHLMGCAMVFVAGTLSFANFPLPDVAALRWDASTRTIMLLVVGPEDDMHPHVRRFQSAKLPSKAKLEPMSTTLWPGCIVSTNTLRVESFAGVAYQRMAVFVELHAHEWLPCGLGDEAATVRVESDCVGGLQDRAAT
jgi:hypothetical protein